MDLNAGPIDIYVVTLQFTLCVFRICFGFVATFLTCLQFIARESFIATKILNVATYLLLLCVATLLQTS